MTHKIVVAALALVFAHSTLAHEVDCEKQVGILHVDAGGNVVLAGDGSPVFSVAPKTVLTLDQYPVTVGWQMKVNNLAGEPSIVRNVEDPSLVASGATLLGALDAPFELAVGQSRTFAAGLRVESYEQCLALAGAPSCQDVVENRFVVTTDTNIAECRARLVCRPQQRCSAPEWTGVIEYLGPGGSSPTIGHGVAVGCDGSTHFVGQAISATGLYAALLARLDAAGAVIEERTWSSCPWSGAWSVALDRWGRRVMVGSYVDQGFLRVVEPDGSVAWEQTSPLVTHGAASFQDAKPDAEGNVYAALVLGTGPTEYAPPDNHDAVVRKYTSAGALVWETSLSTVHRDEVTALAVTPLGDVFVTGFSLGDLIPGATPADGVERFVARLGPDGAIRWIKEVGMVAAGIAVDALGNVAIIGQFSVAALDPQGNVRWERPLETAKPSTGSGVAIDSTAAVWVVGSTDPSTSTSLGRMDAFVARYDAAGGLLWAKQLGDDYPVADYFVKIVVDAAGYGVAAGTRSAPDPQVVEGRRRNVLLLRIAPDGTY